jgi:hypothetical protein
MKTYLRSVERPHTFWLKKDEYHVVSEVHSLEELLVHLRKVDSISHHLSGRRNDFAAWVEKAIQDVHLAARLRNISPGPDALPRLIRELEGRVSMIKACP